MEFPVAASIFLDMFSQFIEQQSAMIKVGNLKPIL